MFHVPYNKVVTKRVTKLDLIGRVSITCNIWVVCTTIVVLLAKQTQSVWLRIVCHWPGDADARHKSLIFTGWLIWTTYNLFLHSWQNTSYSTSGRLHFFEYGKENIPCSFTVRRATRKWYIIKLHIVTGTNWRYFAEDIFNRISWNEDLAFTEHNS